MRHRWVQMAALVLLCPEIARADFRLGSGPEAVFNVLPSWIFGLLSALFNGLFSAIVDPLIAAIDLNGDGV